MSYPLVGFYSYQCQELSSFGQIELQYHLGSILRKSELVVNSREEVQTSLLIDHFYNLHINAGELKLQLTENVCKVSMVLTFLRATSNLALIFWKDTSCEGGDGRDLLLRPKFCSLVCAIWIPKSHESYVSVTTQAWCRMEAGVFCYELICHCQREINFVWLL